MSAEAAVRPDRAIRRMAAFLLAVAVVLIGVAGVAVRNISGARAASDWVNQTHALILELDGVEAQFRTAEGALRAFAATGDNGDLLTAREALFSLAEHVSVATALAQADPALRVRVAPLGELAAARAEAARAVIAARQGGQPTAPLLSADAWTSAWPALRTEVARLKEEQMALLAARDTEQFLQAQTTRWTVWAGVVVNLILLAGMVWLIRDDHAARNRAAQVLADANRQLESKVAERTAALTAANQRLQTENLERRWAAQAIEHQLHYNQLIVDSITDLVFVLTKGRNVSRVNPAVVHATGREPAEMINHPLSEFVLPITPAGGEFADPLARALHEGRDLRDLPARLQDNRGGWHPAQCTVFPLRDGNKVVGGIAIVRLNPDPKESL
jgi:PAS domain-containing protein